ncbi:hypothetical protein DIPPA_28715 [Diplonema papillatum]|nr:hypothetical protein DIPPA_28715 [Diplonema papillatum]
MDDVSVTASDITETAATSSIASANDDMEDEGIAAVPAHDTVTSSSPVEYTPATLLRRSANVEEFTITLGHSGDDLGIHFETSDDGVFIASADSLSPAEHMPTGRKILRIAGHHIVDVEGVNHALHLLRAQGRKTFTIEFSRDLLSSTKRLVKVKLLRPDQSLGFDYEIVESIMVVTAVDKNGAFAHAGIPPGALIHSLSDTSIHNAVDLARAVASLRRRGVLEYKFKMTLHKGGPAHVEGAGFFSTPPRSLKEDEKREKLRRQIQVHRLKAEADERRIDCVNGFAMTFLEFVRNYGDRAGRERWHNAATERTDLVRTVDLAPTQKLRVADLGKRVQVLETGQVLVAVTDRGRVAWYKVSPAELTRRELSYQDVIDAGLGQEIGPLTTIRVGVDDLAPPFLLSVDDVGQRAQVEDTGEVVSVEPQGDGFGWKRVPEVNWSTHEHAFARSLTKRALGTPQAAQALSSQGESYANKIYLRSVKSRTIAQMLAT